MVPSYFYTTLKNIDQIFLMETSSIYDKIAKIHINVETMEKSSKQLLENNRVIGARIRSMRLAKGLSLKELAAKVNKSPSYMSQIETGKVNFSISRTKKICEALGVSVVELLDDTYSEDYKLIEQKTLRWFPEGKSKKIYHAQIYDDKKTMSVNVINLAANSKTETRIGDKWEEISIVLKGTVTVYLEGEDPITLHKRDVLSYPANLPHYWSNNRQEPARVLIISEPEIGV